MSNTFLDYLIYKSVQNWAEAKKLSDVKVVEEDGTKKAVGVNEEGEQEELDITKPEAAEDEEEGEPVQEGGAARRANRAVATGLLPPQCAPYVSLKPKLYNQPA